MRNTWSPMLLFAAAAPLLFIQIQKEVSYRMYLQKKPHGWRLQLHFPSPPRRQKLIASICGENTG